MSNFQPGISLINELQVHKNYIDVHVNDVRSSIETATKSKVDLEERIKSLSVELDDTKRAIISLERTYKELLNRLDAIEVLTQPIE